jgi:hypothetical protein
MLHARPVQIKSSLPDTLHMFYSIRATEERGSNTNNFLAEGFFEKGINGIFARCYHDGKSYSSFIRARLTPRFIDSHSTKNAQNLP